MGHRPITFSLGKTVLATFVFAGALAFGATPRANANECQNRIRHADHELHKAAERHGWDSPQAAERRKELFEARQWCWEHAHRWWDEDGRRWRTERDWDEHDHDRR